MDALPPIACAFCGRKNPADSQYCSSCGKPTALGAKIKLSQERPRSIAWITFFSVISAAWGLYYSDIWTTLPSPYDRYQIFTRITAFISFPLDALLLVTSIALLTRNREWGRKWILIWAAIATIYQTAVVFITMLWIAPMATTGDVPPEMAQALPLISWTPGQAIDGDATFAWLSILFLTTWIGWTLTRPKIKVYFQAENAATPPIS
jgi:Na+/H+-dicarboxylate symporter